MRLLFLSLVLCSMTCDASAVLCTEVFTRVENLNTQAQAYEARRTIRLLTEQAMQPILREIIEELSSFNFNRRNAELEIIDSAEVRPSDSTLQRSRLRPLEVFDQYFPQTVLVRVGRDDIMIEVGVNSANRAAVTEVAEVFSAFGRHLFFSRTDLVGRWESMMMSSNIIRNNTFSEGSFSRLYEDMSNSILVTFSLLTSNLNSLRVPQSQIIEFLVGGTSGGRSFFDVLVIGFAPGYIGPYGSVMYFSNPLAISSGGRVVLTPEAIASIRLSKEIWEELNPVNVVPTRDTIRETGRGCPMARCSTPGELTTLTNAVIATLRHTSLLD